MLIYQRVYLVHNFIYNWIGNYRTVTIILLYLIIVRYLSLCMKYRTVLYLLIYAWIIDYSYNLNMIPILGVFP